VKLASLKAGGRDGTLIVVDRALRRWVAVPEIAATLQQAIDDWSNCAPRLNAVAEALQGDSRGDARALDFATLAAPFPRAFEFVDGSAYLPHVERVRRARGTEVPESFYIDPLMYQATAAGFLGPATRYTRPTRTSAVTRPRSWSSPTTCRWGSARRGRRTHPVDRPGQRRQPA
jgi:fumarylacetoacetate (FAA) hydrolase